MWLHHCIILCILSPKEHTYFLMAPLPCILIYPKFLNIHNVCGCKHEILCNPTFTTASISFIQMHFFVVDALTTPNSASKWCSQNKWHTQCQLPQYWPCAVVGCSQVLYEHAMLLQQEQYHHPAMHFQNIIPKLQQNMVLIGQTR